MSDDKKKDLVPIQIWSGVRHVPRDMANFLVANQYAAWIGGSEPEPKTESEPEPESKPTKGKAHAKSAT